MRVLTINTGSSSLKFQVLDVVKNGAGEPSTSRLALGRIASIGERAERFFVIGNKKPIKDTLRISDHRTAIQNGRDWLKHENVWFEAVAHRIVHGGNRFVHPTLIDDEVIRSLQGLSDLAPLHNPVGIDGIVALREALGSEFPMVAVFDTSFHASIPPVAATYAIPRDISERHRIRRYGFHGIAHSYLTSRYARLTGIPLEKTRFITVHLGHGCSMTAIKGGQSVDTSMGFTPLEGLVMATRSGDLDPAIVAYLCEKESADVSHIIDLMNHESGLVGISGRTSNMKELLEMEGKDEQARLAIEVFCYRVKKYIGSYLAVLSGADAIIFSGGIGENAPSIRARICSQFEWGGIVLDSQRNETARGKEAVISVDGASPRVLVIPVDEESVIAREAFICLQRKRAGK
jgi:acetate kinase